MTIIDNNEGLRWFKGHLSNLFYLSDVTRIYNLSQNVWVSLNQVVELLHFLQFNTIW